MTDPTPPPELGPFLRSRRERLTPDALGLPRAAGRRAKGLRREEVASLAHLSPTWYAYLEQGRPVRPSPEVLDSLASTLQLDATERRYLHAVGATPASATLPDPRPDEAALAVVGSLVEASGAMPYPVYAMDARFGLVACNAHMPEWYTDFSTREGRERNFVWWVFTDPEARVRIADWESDTRELTARIRYFHATNRPDPGRERLIRDLRATSPEFARWWSTYDVTEQIARARGFHHPRLGTCQLQLVVVRPSVCPTVSVVFHIPDPDPRAG